MIIKKVTASAFGRLKDWESPDFSPRLTVLYGHNETGKSTLFNLIVTLLYGWKPVKDNEYIPWAGTAPLIKGELVAGNGQELEVSRRLRGQPEGSLVMEGRITSLRNEPLPQVAFMPREVFQEIYALGLDQLRFPDPAAWQKLQDQLLGGQFGSFLRPVSAVLPELSGEAAGLWRADRRGNPRSKVLDQELKELRHKIREAEENEQELRRLEVELDQLAARHRLLREDKVRLTALLRRYSIMIPLRRQLQRLLELQAEAGNVARFDFLPAQPDQERNRLQAEIQELQRKRHALTEKIRLAIQVESAYGDADREVIALGGIIRPLVRRSGQLQGYLDRQWELEQKLEVNQRRLEDRAGQFLKGGWRPELAGPVKAVDEVELRAAVDAYSSANQKRNEAAARLEGLKSVTGAAAGLRMNKRVPAAAVLMLLAGAAGSLWGGISPLGIGSAMVGAAGAILLVLWFLSGTREQEGVGAARAEEIRELLAGLEEECRSIRQEVREALQGLPVAEQRVGTPDGSLLLEIKDVQALIREQEDFRQEMEAAERSLAEAAATLEEPLRACRLEQGLGLLQGIDLLDQKLAAAGERQQQAAAAEKVRAEASSGLEEVEGKLKAAQESLGQLQEGLAALPGATWQEQLESLLGRRRARQQTETMESELQRQYPDLEQLKAEIQGAEAAGENWIHSDEAEVRARLELEETDEELNRVSGRTGTAENELSSRQRRERLDDLQGQVCCLQEELAETARERDRLLLLHNLLAAADRKFREEHQPDVLQKAGRRLATITGGRYTRLAVEEGGGLELQSSYYDYPLEVKHPLSRGTLEQVYLALRLALVDHLDTGGERLPLFLDEVLVNWDGSRLEKGLLLLEELSASRQVFLFTCHSWLAAKLRDKAHIVTL